MYEEHQNPIDIIRCSKREDLKDVREKHKEAVLGNRRLRLNEVSNYIQDVNPSEFKELLLKLKEKNVPLELIRKVKNSLGTVENIEVFFRNGEALNYLMHIFTGKDALKQVEATACLTNLVCGSHKCCQKVAKLAGAYLVSFINGNNHVLQDQSAWTAANIANDCSDCFTIIKSQGILPALLSILNSPVSSVVQSAVFALSACTKYEDPDVISLVQSGFHKNLLCLISLNTVNKSLFLDAAFTLSNCCYLSSKYSLEIFDPDAVQLLIVTFVKVIHNPEMDILVTTPLIRCLGFLSYSDKCCDLISEHCDFYTSIQIILSKKECIHLKKEVIWVLSNIIAQRSMPCTYVVPLIDSLKALISSENMMTLQVLYLLTSLVSTHESENLLLKQHDIFSLLKCLLESEQPEVKHAATVFFEIVEATM